MIGGDRQQEHQRQASPAKIGVRLWLADRDPVCRKPHIVSADPRHRRQEKVPNQEPDGQNLAAALEHGCPRPWGLIDEPDSNLRPWRETHPWNRALDERLVGRPPTSTPKTAESSEQRLVARRVKACQGVVTYAPVQYRPGRPVTCPSKMVCAPSADGLRIIPYVFEHIRDVVWSSPLCGYALFLSG